IPLVEDIAAFRHLMAAPNRREDDVPMRHEDARDGVELRSAAGVLLAAVVPDDRRERSGAVRPEQKPRERQALALERDGLFRGRGRLSGGGRDSDCERRHGTGEQTMHGVGQPTATGLEPSTPRTRVEISPDLGDRMPLPNRTMLIDARTLTEGTT